MRIHIDTYYDLTCECCGRSWSTDFNEALKQMNTFGDGGMGMETDKARLTKRAYAAGWKYMKGHTVCPECQDYKFDLKFEHGVDDEFFYA